MRHRTLLRWLIAGLLLCPASQSVAGNPGQGPGSGWTYPDGLGRGFLNLDSATSDRLKASRIPEKSQAAEIAKYCAELTSRFARYRWESDPCGKVPWRADVMSHDGHPLIYAEFGSGERITLLLSGVHPDELTPIPLAFRFARHLQDNPRAYRDLGVKVVIAPLVNPDGFYKDRPTRANANGVDLNRNFFTTDWYSRAKKLWTQRRNRNPQYFPGHFPNSELETVFQIHLIDRFRPDKIVSMHAPLGFLDYDGPGDIASGLKRESDRQAKKLVEAISVKSQNYDIVDFDYYPGSLGNFAGNERRIPTVTLELQTADPSKADAYWNQFLPGLLESVQFPIHDPTLYEGTESSLFYGEFLEAVQNKRQI